jgi:hypothetical protein
VHRFERSLFSLSFRASRKATREISSFWIAMRFEISPRSLRSGLRPFEMTVLFVEQEHVQYFQHRTVRVIPAFPGKVVLMRRYTRRINTTKEVKYLVAAG